MTPSSLDTLAERITLQLLSLPEGDKDRELADLTAGNAVLGVLVREKLTKLRGRKD